jgi:hypothetical protein
MDKIELVRNIRKPGVRAVELDFQNPMHREWILSMYGGEEKVRSLLPVFYEAFKNTVENLQD